MDLNEILETAVEARASDIHLKAGLPPIFRRDNKLVPYKDELVGYITAQGFDCEHKPNAWAASWAADNRC